MPSENIFQQYLQPVRSVADYTADLDKQEANQLALVAERLKNKAAQQSFDDDQSYRQAGIESSGDQNKLVQALIGKGLVKQALEVQKNGLANQKTAADIKLATSHSGKFDQETQDAQRMSHIKSVGLVQTPEDALNWSTEAVKKGILTPEQFQSGIQRIPEDAAGLQKWKAQVLQGGLSALEQLHSNEPKPTETRLGNVVKYLDMNPRSPTFGKGVAPVQTIGQSPDNAATNATSRANNAASLAQADRHFNTTQENSKGQIVQTDNGPVLVNTRTGEGKVVTGPDGKVLPGVTKQLNESQSKALLFGNRMQESDRILEQLAKQGSTTSVPGSRVPYVGALMNTMLSPNMQELNQAKLDFMTAVLRRESGAAISKNEYDNADKQYFPQVGDSQAVIAQKARNRKLAIEGILSEVPSNKRSNIKSFNQENDIYSQADAILRGGK